MIYKCKQIYSKKQRKKRRLCLNKYHLRRLQLQQENRSKIEVVGKNEIKGIHGLKIVLKAACYAGGLFTYHILINLDNRGLYVLKRKVLITDYQFKSIEYEMD